MGHLVARGHELTPSPIDADVLVVNTCSFIDPAKKESVDTILEMAEYKKSGRAQRLIVAGCLVERYRDDICKNIPEVDAVLGTGQWHDIVHAARHVLAGVPERMVRTDAPGGALDPDAPRALSTPRHLAYLKISEGCDHRCTFCIIPKLRGDQKSRTIRDLVAEASALAARGVKEINLIGQDTTGWGADLPGKPELADLLAELDRVEGLTWIRVQYTYPRLWSDRLIETWARAKRIVPYVDMPLQHIAADMLRTMARGMTARDTRALVRRIKSGIPGVAFRTNFIVGFPGETDEHFAELERYLEEEPFDHVVVFNYEREPDTPAWEMVPRVPLPSRRHRRARLLATQQRLSAERLRRRIGHRVTVMIDGPTGPRDKSGGSGQYAARTSGSAWEVHGGVAVQGEHLEPGNLVPVRVTGSAAYDLFARVDRNDNLLPLVKGPA